jgi:hypothetical protein
MPTERNDNQRNERTHQQRAELKRTLPQPLQTAHPFDVEGPEALRDSHC